MCRGCTEVVPNSTSAAIGGDRWRSVSISGDQCRTAAPPPPGSSVNRQPVAINQWQSVLDCSSAFSRLSVSRQSVAVSGNQWQSVAISGNQCQPLPTGEASRPARSCKTSALGVNLNSFNRRQSVPNSGNQWQPLPTGRTCRPARSCSTSAISATQCQSVPTSVNKS